MKLDEPFIFGRDWYYEPRGWRDVIRCLLGRHRNVMTGLVNGDWICRCSCGAIRMLGGQWCDPRPFTRRKANRGHA